MTRSLAETVMGAVVLIVAGVFVYLFVTATQVKSVDGYTINATFLKVGGLQRGSDVRMSGIKIGSVKSRTLNKDFEADVVLSISSDVRLPVDTVATITNDGLLGGKYVRLRAGKAREFIKADGRLDKTEDFKSIEDQVSEIIFLAGGSGGSK